MYESTYHISYITYHISHITYFSNVDQINYILFDFEHKLFSGQ